MRQVVLHDGYALAFVRQVDGSPQPIVGSTLFVQSARNENVRIRTIADMYATIWESEMLVMEKKFFYDGAIVFRSRIEGVGACAACLALCIGKAKNKSIR
ncbi:hypothetical protein HMPREF1989_01204 [Porphyromonas gingivalis F0566]|nr:hypothetical protein HMPREF1989_01204 [Porphyromonas gingivalis F0566]